MKKMFAILMLCSFAVAAAPVNINSADAETIAKALKGVGSKKAEEIVKYRKEHGDFKTLKDVENVKGIGPNIIKVNEKDILFTDEAAPAPAASEPTPAPKAPETDKNKPGLADQPK
ncbi:MAG: ComEA family DNA-binding protein [Methylomonas sp.]